MAGNRHDVTGIHEMNRWLRFSVICGAAPLTVGVAIFLTWLLTRWDWLMLAGVLTIYSGLVVVAVGTIGVVLFVWKSVRVGHTPRKHVAWQALTVSGFLLLNVPVAAAIVASVIYIETQYVVTVINDSSAEVHSFVVSGGGVTIDIGTIAPGSEVRRAFIIKHDGELKGQGMQGGRPIEGIIEGYVTNGLGGNKLVRIQSDGTLGVADRENRRHPTGDRE